MDLEAFTKLQNDEYEFLDSLDLKPYLKEGLDICDLRDKIEEDHSKDYYEGIIFNCINIDEFIDYLEGRYGDEIYFNEHITYSLHFRE